MGWEIMHGDRKLIPKFEELYGIPPSIFARAPGRVNILGEHVDYNDGLVLPAAIDRQVHLLAAPTEGETVELHALDLGQSTSFRISELAARKQTDGKTLPGWALYPAGVAWSLMKEGLHVSGLQALYTSDIPIGAGLSSSAAIEVGFAVIWELLGNWHPDRLALAQLCQRAENQYVGVSCGIMDQFASLCGVEGKALCFDTRGLDWEPLPLPPDSALVIADSGVRRDLTSSAYNERRAACEQAVLELKRYLPHIHALRDVESTEFAAYRPYLSPDVRDFAEHVVKEIARVRSALSAMNRNDPGVLGALMFAGHASLRDLYQVSTPELDALVEIARQSPGIIGARLTGAGFGGCTINLVEDEHTESFTKALKTGYAKETGRSAEVYICKASQGASARHLS